MLKKRRRRRKRVTFIQRFFRTLVAVVILSAFILGLSLFVGKTANLDPYQMAELAGPILEKVGISTEKAGQVAGTFADRVLRTNIAPSESYKEELGGSSTIGDEGSATSRKVVFKTAFLSDSENNDDNLRKALFTAESAGVGTVFFLGDYTEFGVLEELEQAYNIMEESGLLYYSLPGDRDLDINSPVANHDNYFKVFGQPQISVSFSDIKFVMLNNSANKTIIDSENIRQFVDEKKDADYVVLSQPLYHPLASVGKPIMGLVKGEEEPEVNEQREELLKEIRDSNVRAVFAGDHHSFSRSEDPVKEGLEHVAVGPVTDIRADQSKASITILYIYDDGSYSVEEIFFE